MKTYTVRISIHHRFFRRPPNLLNYLCDWPSARARLSTLEYQEACDTPRRKNGHLSTGRSPVEELALESGAQPQTLELPPCTTSYRCPPTSVDSRVIRRHYTQTTVRGKSVELCNAHFAMLGQHGSRRISNSRVLGHPAA